MERHDGGPSRSHPSRQEACSSLRPGSNANPVNDSPEEQFDFLSPLQSPRNEDRWLVVEFPVWVNEESRGVSTERIARELQHSCYPIWRAS